MAQFKSEIGSNARALLADRGMTIKELSEKADMHYTTARRFVDGHQENISKTIMAKFCQALDCQVGDLFFYQADAADTD